MSEGFRIASTRAAIIYNTPDISLLENRICQLFSGTNAPDALMVAGERLVITCLRVCKKMNRRAYNVRARAATASIYARRRRQPCVICNGTDGVISNISMA